MNEVFLGIDVGSVTTKFVAVDRRGELLTSLYLRTAGQPIQALREGLTELAERLPSDARVLGVGTTGSGRQLADAIIGADVVKNEITAHAIAAWHFVPDVRTVIDIGGQDSKLILIRDGIVVDFA
ncbi:MAG: 2-hydroxyglutaryl-CoA dehydratase, partial [Anaerolineae bacterium]|nr:2-hydroxyglutaryl-CoA dehydratase [Anaerolineae bacterium]